MQFCGHVPNKQAPRHGSLRVFGQGVVKFNAQHQGKATAAEMLRVVHELIAGVLGFATVGVNMRGSGCSGGVLDLFDLPTSADGYDVIETVAAQPWVKGGRVGMIGISFPGISQIFVGGARPPHLAAIAARILSLRPDLKPFEIKTILYWMFRAMKQG